MVLLALLTAWLPEARAHDLEFTFTVVVIRPDGSYQVDVTADLDALALGVGQGGNSARLAARRAGLAPAELDARLAALHRILTERLALRFDGRPADLVPVFPERGTLMDAEVPSYLGLTARFAGQIPVGAGTLTFQASRGFPPVYLTILDQGTTGTPSKSWDAARRVRRMRSARLVPGRPGAGRWPASTCGSGSGTSYPRDWTTSCSSWGSSCLVPV